MLLYSSSFFLSNIRLYRKLSSLVLRDGLSKHEPMWMCFLVTLNLRTEGNLLFLFLHLLHQFSNDNEMLVLLPLKSLALSPTFKWSSMGLLLFLKRPRDPKILTTDLREILLPLDSLSISLNIFLNSSVYHCNK
jgi:hypothetical protein